MSFAPTERQRQAIDTVLSGLATWVMLFGGGRSGKTFLIIRTIVLRALKAPGSRHLIVRFRFVHLRASIIADTFPRVMRLCFPGVHYDLSRTEWVAKLPGGSEIWFGGLDEGDRMEKLLGMEFVTIYINEASQVSWGGVMLLLTRLAQKVMQVLPGRAESPLKLRFLFDCNPPSKAHWSFKVFKQKLDPETKEPLREPNNYDSFLMNPADNAENLSSEYLQTLEGLSERMKRRFVRGEFADATPNALFDEAVIDRWRVNDGQVPAYQRVVVSVDPSGASDDEQNADNDEVGITVDALGIDSRAYLVEDLTVKGGPTVWGRIAVEAYMRHKADVIVGESNFGGGMVQQTIQVAAARAETRVFFKMVTASRGKIQRAEPFSALYEDGKVRHVGLFPKLEDELCAFSTGGYTGPRSPNRADAHIWGLAELFPAMTKTVDTSPKVNPLPSVSHFRRGR
ncbi:phage terminase large subunit [Variovorax paradoxus]|uniref:phage terminase large subunit n=1 Tax=Variovorax paradoxus TaxID=34073 RepID=UPI0019313C9A